MGEGVAGKNSAWIVRVEPVSSLESDYSAPQLALKVGRRIKEVRLERGLSRRDFGAKLGVSGQQIEKYENGKDAVPLHRLLTLASICGLSAASLWSCMRTRRQTRPVLWAPPTAAARYNLSGHTGG